MVRRIGTCLAVVLLSLTLVVGQSRAEMVTYKFSGQLPSSEPDGINFELDPGTDMGGLVNPGDHWTAFFEVDLETGNLNEGIPGLEGFGDYLGAATNAYLEFESGYSTTLTPTDPLDDFGEIGVFNNFFLPTSDGVAGTVSLGDPERLDVAIYNEDYENTLDSVDLPTFPTAFNQNVSGEPVEVLAYSSPGGGFVSYLSFGDGSFEVVPEPSTMAIWCIAAMGLGCVWWRKRRAR